MNKAPELIDVAKLIANELGLEDVLFCGKGAFKETFRVRKKNGAFIALKIVDRTKIDLVRTEREITALKKCNSSRIARFIDTKIFTAPNGLIYDVVLEEFFDGGSLETKIGGKQLTKKEVVELAVGLVKAIKDLHQLNLVHRDIKPANIMYRNGSSDPALVDFGLVRDLSQASLTATWLSHGPGTPLFAPPEQLNNDKGLIDWRSDQFSIGVLAGILLVNRHPYQTDPANITSAIQATHERKGPSADFRQMMLNMGLPCVTKMVSAWPIHRFAHPDQILATLNP